MKNVTISFIFLSLCSFSCGLSVRDIFSKKTPHEKYAEKLDDRNLDKTPEGRAWLQASKKAVEAPFAISLPYRQQGVFHADKARALGLRFAARPGERLTFTLSAKGGAALPLYADLFKEGKTETPILSVDTTKSAFSIDIDEAGNYILRLQPELFRTGDYSLSVAVGPSLDFPVSGKKANVGSTWGAQRDGGKRLHEGIDIFAPKRTPAVAAADGFVVGVRDGGIGGKTVWLRPEGKAYTLYYAHLDEQSVHEGQRVKRGDVVGLVGNTGNAATTPPHLHFGIYTVSGAVDPLPYVNREVKTAPSFPDKKLTYGLKLTKTQKTEEGSTVKANTLLVPLAANAKGFVAEAPDGSLLQVPFNAVQATKEPVRQASVVALASTKDERKS